MSLFGSKEKKEIERLKAQMLPEQVTLADLQGKIEDANAQLDRLLGQITTERDIQSRRKVLSELEHRINTAEAQMKSRAETANRDLERVKKQISDQESKLSSLKQEIIETDEALLLQSFGFFTPHYIYKTSEEYKSAIAAVRQEQKQLVKDKEAIMGATNWQVNGSSQQGQKMLSDLQKLLLRAFNAECDDAIEHVKFNNYDSSSRKITASYEAISKLGTVMDIHIAPQYHSLKQKELKLMYEYQQKKQDEKEALREARAMLREEAKVAKEMEEAKKKLEKEQSHYNNALAKVLEQLVSASDADRTALVEKKAEIEARLNEIQDSIKQVDYRFANQRAGYVYIISNIGAFGENVYKIGMTRRLDPMERIDELSDASVPFNFDVHAMIFSDDAPALESALHRAFEDRKLNMVNTRREFFRVSLDEIKAVVKSNFDKSVEFVDMPPAEQYRQSLSLKNAQ